MPLCSDSRTWKEYLLKCPCRLTQTGQSTKYTLIWPKSWNYGYKFTSPNISSIKQGQTKPQFASFAFKRVTDRLQQTASKLLFSPSYYIIPQTSAPAFYRFPFLFFSLRPSGRPPPIFASLFTFFFLVSVRSDANDDMFLFLELLFESATRKRIIDYRNLQRA